MKLGGWVEAALTCVVIVAGCASPAAQGAATGAQASDSAQAHGVAAASGAAANGPAANDPAVSGAAASGAAANGAATSGAAANGPATSGAAASGASTSAATSGSAASSGNNGASTSAATSGNAGSSGSAAAAASGSGGASSAPTAGSAGTPGQSAAKGCDASWLFCDDFETKTTPGMPPSAPWTIAKNGMGSVTVDTQTPAHSGKSSVKVSSDGGYQTFFALTGAPLFPHDGPLYLRLYIKLEAAMTSGHNTYYKAGASGSPSSEHETRMGVMNGMLMINQPAGDRGFLSNEEYYRDGNKPGVVFAPMKWECVETFFDPANKTIDVWVNGNEVKDLHRTDWEQDPIGAFHFGFEKYAGPDAVIWYDDIAVDTQPIGCPG